MNPLGLAKGPAAPPLPLLPGQPCLPRKPLSPQEGTARWEMGRKGETRLWLSKDNEKNESAQSTGWHWEGWWMLHGGTEGLRMSERAVGRIIIAGGKQKRVTIFLWMDSALMLLNSC